MELTGYIKHIIYRNDGCSFAVAIFQPDHQKGTIKIAGDFATVEEGTTLRINGEDRVHKDYGNEFWVSEFEILQPSDSNSIEKYLSSGIIKGIGPANAEKIVKKFGDDTLNVLKLEPEKLAEIKGITKEKAIEMGEEFNEKWDLWEIVNRLGKFGVNPSNAKNIYDELGSDAVKKIDENPYLLIDTVYGANFNKIDEVALESGIPKNNDDRIKSGIKYALLSASYNGNTCVLEENLINYVMEMLEVEREEIEDNIINLKATEEIVVEKREKDNWVYLYPLYKVEQNIYRKLTELKKNKNVKHIKNFNNALRNEEKKLGIELSEKQFEALEQINDNNVCIITGGPGTGKTTIIKCMLEVYKSHGKKVVLCAPTGRAAKRISETTGEEAKTIHRLLEIGKVEDDKIHNIDIELKPIDADVIVVDEASMVDCFLMNYILNAMYLDSKLVLVGDSDQLPSVGPGCVLKDLIDSGEIASVSLNKIFRQAAKSKIIVNAHDVNDGNSFIGKTYNEDQLDDFFYLDDGDQDHMLKEVVSLSMGRIRSFVDYDFDNVQILTPTKQGKLGTRELNNCLQNVLNPRSNEKEEKRYGRFIFREGDRVMQVENDYDIYWEKEDENGTGIFNGELGIISEIDNYDRMMYVKFDDGKFAYYDFADLDELELAYSITIHKAQGSEFDVVVMVVPEASPKLLTRNLLYTGMTRAKKMLILIGKKDTIEGMIENSEIKRRNTGLLWKLKN